MTIETLFIIAVAMAILTPFLFLVISLIPPKTPNKGTILALLLGPLAYIYVGRWGKAIGLFVIGWISLIGHLIIWPYAIFNIRTEVRRHNEEAEIHQQRLADARKRNI